MRVWLRPQFSPETGLGHLMRTLAVAEFAAERGLDVTCVTNAAIGELSRLPARFGFATSDSRDWLEQVAPGDAVLFDGYGFSPEDHRRAAERGARVAAIDDFGAGRFEVDLLVNPNPVTDPRYETRPGSSVLIGPRFAMVRAGFRAKRRLRTGATSRLVVVLGGSDATGLTPIILDLLRDHRRFQRVALLRGPAASPVQIEPDDAGWLDLINDPDDVPAVFDGADAAIAAAGTTTWELLTMGVPTALVQVAENQRHVIAIAEQGCALSLGGPADLPDRLPSVLTRLADPEEQRRLSRAALRAIDGLGAARVLTALLGDSA
jgi:spore coat polysaccharide biosynthesis predicted glycosyltransferase SpsG